MSASVPTDPRVCEEGVLLLPAGGVAGLPRSLYSLRRRVAEMGRPVMTFEYPGSGQSPLPGIDNSRLPGLQEELLAWVRSELGLRITAVVGVCKGAWLALILAASEPDISQVFVINCPLKRRAQTPGPRAAARRALSRVSRLKATAGQLAKVVGGDREADRRWIPGLVSNLRSTTDHAQIHFLYGAEDRFYGEFRELLASRVLAPGEADAIQYHVLQGPLRMSVRPSAAAWMNETIVNHIRAGAPSARG